MHESGSNPRKLKTQKQFRDKIIKNARNFLESKNKLKQLNVE